MRTEPAELALAPIESLDDEIEFQRRRSVGAEIDRRVAEIDRDEVRLIPGDKVFDELPPQAWIGEGLIGLGIGRGHWQQR